MLSLILIIVILTVLISYQGLSNPDFKEKSLFVPYKVKYQKEYYRIFSHIFIHADFIHLSFNMISLYFLGSLLENEWNYAFGIQANFYLIALYFGGAIAATLWPYFRNAENPAYRSLGASGAVSAVIFAAMLWNPQIELYLFPIPIPIKAYVLAPLYLVFEYYSLKRGCLLYTSPSPRD